MGSGPGAINLLGIASAFGFAIVAMAYGIGPISGCHVNPAVSFGVFFAGRMSASEMVSYWIAQVLGPIVAAAVLYLILSGKAPCSAWARSTRTNSTPPSISWAAVRPASRRFSPSATSRTACWCSTTSPRAIWRGGGANWRNSATAVIIRRDRPQIVFGLLCTTQGCPVAVEVFEGHLGDPSTLANQVRKLRMRFRLKRIVLVGDRGMITQARIDADLEPAGFDWITALRAPTVQALAAEGGPLQLSLFDERDMAEIASDDYPGERLIVCRNPELAAERARKRVELLDATETALAKIRAATERKRNPLRGKDKIGLRVGGVIDRRHMAKHFELAITDTSFAWSRKAEAIAAEAALDGIYVIRSNLPHDGFPAAAIVLAYKGLSHAERGFRDLKSGDLDVRPIHHRRAHRVRAHVFLCMLAY